MTYSAIGHSHLDLLFLWPERETWRKCARTLSTVVKMMDRFPEYRFCLSQAREQIETLKEKLAGCLELRGMKEPMTVFNPVSFRRTERLEWEGRELTVTLEPFEILAADGASAEPEEVKARQEQAVRFG